MTTLQASPPDLARSPLIPQLQDPDLLRPGGFIGGQWDPATTGPALHVADPATGERLASLAVTAQARALQAVHAASQAHPASSPLPAQKPAARPQAWHGQHTE